MNIKETFSKDEFDKDINPCLGIGTNALDMVSCLTPIVNVDLLIINEDGKVLVSWRNDDVCGTGWHIPGGIVRYKESFEQRIRKVAEAELGIFQFSKSPQLLEINEIFLPQDVRGHFISLLYQCDPIGIIKTVSDKNGYSAGDLHWFDYNKDISLIKGQKEIYTKYLRNSR